MAPRIHVITPAFFLWVAVLMLPFFYFWFVFAPFLVPGVAAVVDFVATPLFGGRVAKVGAQGHLLLIFSAVDTATHKGVGLIQAKVGFTSDIRAYSYGMPLFAALAIASAGTLSAHLRRIVLGLTVLAAMLCFSVCSDIAYTLTFSAQFSAAPLLADGSSARGLIRFSYYLGFLVLPAAVPLALWAALYLPDDTLDRRTASSGTISRNFSDSPPPPT